MTPHHPPQPRAHEARGQRIELQEVRGLDARGLQLVTPAMEAAPFVVLPHVPTVEHHVENTSGVATISSGERVGELLGGHP